MEVIERCEEYQTDHEVAKVEMNKPSSYRIAIWWTRSKARSSDEIVSGKVRKKEAGISH